MNRQHAMRSPYHRPSREAKALYSNPDKHTFPPPLQTQMGMEDNPDEFERCKTIMHELVDQYFPNNNPLGGQPQHKIDSYCDMVRRRCGWPLEKYENVWPAHLFAKLRQTRPTSYPQKRELQLRSARSVSRPHPPPKAATPGTAPSRSGTPGPSGAAAQPPADLFSLQGRSATAVSRPGKPSVSHRPTATPRAHRAPTISTDARRDNTTTAPPTGRPANAASEAIGGGASADLGEFLRSLNKSLDRILPALEALGLRDVPSLRALAGIEGWRRRLYIWLVMCADGEAVSDFDWWLLCNGVQRLAMKTEPSE
ncbi:hypothetical protein C8Q77DRAFT_539531 [Trametes polyzona]|nr:hypothetical protein C8Q77DRAFT_539531 [Trametes polyzona]